MDLHWSGPYALPRSASGLPPVPKTYGGAYLNCFPYDGGGFVMWGPGETGQSFYQRWQGHVRETRDGRRGVLDVEDACRSLKTVLWRGARTKDPTRRIEFAGRSDLREALERQFAKQCLCYHSRLLQSMF